MQEQEFQYVGFWTRVLASLIDTVFLAAIIYPLLYAFYGSAYFDLTETRLVIGPADFLLSYVLPAIAIIVLWLIKEATPGKMLVSAKIVDAKTGGPISTGQAIGRYLGYYVSLLPLGLGFLWVAFDKRKQGWHDKLAGTVVVPDRITPDTVRFDQF